MLTAFQLRENAKARIAAAHAADAHDLRLYIIYKAQEAYEQGRVEFTVPTKVKLDKRTIALDQHKNMIHTMAYEAGFTVIAKRRVWKFKNPIL